MNPSGAGCDIGQDLGRVAGKVLAREVVGRHDPALGIDQVANAAGHAPVVVVLTRLALGVVDAAD